MPIPTLPFDRSVITLVSTKLFLVKAMSRRVLEFVTLFSYLERLKVANAPYASELVPSLPSTRTGFGSFSTVLEVTVG